MTVLPVQKAAQTKYIRTSPHHVLSYFVLCAVIMVGIVHRQQFGGWINHFLYYRYDRPHACLAGGWLAALGCFVYYRQSACYTACQWPLGFY